MFLTAATGASRIVSANEGWEERLQNSLQEELEYDDDDDDDDDDSNSSNVMSELDLRAEIAEKSPSRYGPNSERSKKQRRQESNSNTNQINIELEFETEYGIPFDPYYDLPYEEDELPIEINYSKDPFFGDRVYENGEQFFKVTKGLYYRKGSRPRMKFVWE